MEKTWNKLGINLEASVRHKKLCAFKVLIYKFNVSVVRTVVV